MLVKSIAFVFVVNLLHSIDSTPQYYHPGESLYTPWHSYFSHRYKPFSPSLLSSFHLGGWADDNLLFNPFVIMDLRIYAIYSILKCWEENESLKKCADVIEKCDALFMTTNMNKGDDKDDDNDNEGKEDDKGDKDDNDDKDKKHKKEERA